MCPSDLNGDGFRNIVVHASTDALELTDGDTETELAGETYEGMAFGGVDTVRIVPG